MVASAYAELEARIIANPHDDGPRLRYADALERADRADGAAYVRERVELVRALEKGASDEIVDPIAQQLADRVAGIDPRVLEVCRAGIDRWPGSLGIAPTRWIPVELPPDPQPRLETFRDLPTRILVIADFTGADDPRPIGERHYDIGVTRETVAELRMTR